MKSNITNDTLYINFNKEDEEISIRDFFQYITDTFTEKPLIINTIIIDLNYIMLNIKFIGVFVLIKNNMSQQLKIINMNVNSELYMGLKNNGLYDSFDINN